MMRSDTHSGAGFRSRRSPLAVALLALVFLLFQQLACIHGLEHAFEAAPAPDTACVECLALSAGGGALAPATPVIVRLPFLSAPAAFAVLPAPTLAIVTAFLGRAPPVL